MNYFVNDDDDTYRLYGYITSWLLLPTDVMAV